MKTLEEIKKMPHLCIIDISPDRQKIIGTVSWEDQRFRGSVICGFNEDGWEHVSISSYNPRRLPTWELMCRLKDMFWDKSEQVVQIHPDEAHYFHGYKGLDNVLHLWRPVNGDWSELNE